MDNEYILGPDGELYHWGIKGMKWGQRRYQNKDGSLTPLGKKRYAQEEAKLKEREKAIKNQERTKAKLAKLDSKKAELDAREKALAENKKPDTDDTPTPKPAQPKTTRDMNDNELQQKVNRLRNEEAYRDLNKKLGYDTPQTEMDARIADLERQKKYLELQRDINNLTPKKVSTGKALMTKIWDKAVEPAVMEAGKTLLKQYLTDVGGAAIADIVAKANADAKIKVDRIERKADAKLKKETAKAQQKQDKKDARDKQKQDKKDAREKEKQAAKEAKEQADKAAKDAKEAAKERGDANRKARDDFYDNYVFDGEVEGAARRKSSDSSSKQKQRDNVIDAEWWEVSPNSSVTDLVSRSDSVSSGRRYIAGLLPEPKNSDSGVSGKHNMSSKNSDSGVSGKHSMSKNSDKIRLAYAGSDKMGQVAEMWYGQEKTAGEIMRKTGLSASEVSDMIEWLDERG